mgnify:CR=1 FL=1
MSWPAVPRIVATMAIPVIRCDWITSRIDRVSKRRTNSSSTKTAPAIGELNAVASPAPAPAATGRIAIYYGAADTYTAVAFTQVDELLAQVPLFSHTTVDRQPVRDLVADEAILAAAAVRDAGLLALLAGWLMWTGVITPL